MGRGRAPCCDKTKVRTGPWSPAEDLRLINFIQKHGHSNWRALPRQAGLLRCGKSCRLRWINYLRPDVKRGNFTPEEEQTIIELHNSIGNKWSKIASCLPGRTDNEIKNVWNTHLKKRLMTINSTVDSKIDHSASSSCASSSVTAFGDENTEKLLGDDQVQETPLREKPELTNATSSTQLKENVVFDSRSSSCVSNFEIMSEEALVYPEPSHATIPHLEDTENEKTDIIPSEFDVDFWQVMDSLDPLQSINGTAQINGDTSVSSVDQETIDGEVELSKWLRILENELGLTGDGDHDQHMMVQANSQFTGFDCSPIWPCSPPHYLGM